MITLRARRGRTLDGVIEIDRLGPDDRVAEHTGFVVYQRRL
jgi:hypothetical protein